MQQLSKSEKEATMESHVLSVGLGKDPSPTIGGGVFWERGQKFLEIFLMPTLWFLNGNLISLRWKIERKQAILKVFIQIFCMIWSFYVVH